MSFRRIKRGEIFIPCKQKISHPDKSGLEMTFSAYQIYCINIYLLLSFTASLKVTQ